MALALSDEWCIQSEVQAMGSISLQVTLALSNQWHSQDKKENRCIKAGRDIVDEESLGN